MKLMMYLKNDLIDTAIVEDDKVPVPGYLGEFKRQMKVKYKDLIKESGIAPEFYVVVTNIPENKLEKTKN
jgi:hypothetical protein